MGRIREKRRIRGSKRGEKEEGVRRGDESRGRKREVRRKSIHGEGGGGKGRRK